MSRTRTFIAVELPKPIRERIVALQGDLGRAGIEVKWVEPENIHVTLVFLGEVDDREIPTVCSLAKEAMAVMEPFRAVVSGVGCFPHARRPRVVWAGIGDGAKDLIRVHGALETVLEATDYRRENRRYTPHITLGRINSDRVMTDRLAAALQRHADWTAGEIAVDEIHIMGSELRRDGPVYTVLGRAALG